MIKQYIPRYINQEKGKSITLQDLGWAINLKTGKNHLVTYCKSCKQQLCFKIVSEKIAISENTGREYVKGYFGYCTFCDGGK